MANLQTRLAVAALAGGGGGLLSGGNDDGGIFGQLTNPCNPVKEEDVMEDDIEQDLAPIPKDKLAKYILRIMVHSGSGFASSNLLPKGTPYCEIVLGEGTTSEFKESSPPLQTSAESPFFGWLFEKEITVEGRAPDCEIRLMEKRLIKNTQMGACKLPLPDVATDGPKRTMLKVFQADSMVRPELMVQSMVGVEKPTAPKILVVYQMVNLEDNDRPDLQRIAEMEAGCTLKKYWTFDIKLNNVKLKRPTQDQHRYRCQFRLFDRSGAQVMKSDSKAVNSAKKIESKADKMKGAAPQSNQADAKPKKNYDIINWGATAEAGETFKWQVYQSQINLMSYTMKVTLLKIKEISEEKASEGGPDQAKGSPRGDISSKTDEEMDGVFEERIGDLLDSIDEKDHKLLFNAVLAGGSQRVGHANMEVDVYPGQNRHREHPIVFALDNLQKAEMKPGGKSAAGDMARSPLQLLTDLDNETPFRNGWHKYSSASDRDVAYSVNCWVTGLQSFGDVSDPFVRVRMGSGPPGETEKRTNEFFNVLFRTSPKVKAKMSDRKAILEVWDSNPRSEDRLIGAVSIYNVESDRLNWFHMYGGAMQAPKKDEAQAMVRGAIKPGSTYQGTIAVSFCTRAKPLNEFQTKVTKNLKKRRLCVRLYRGLYLPEKFRGKKVNIIVQVAGGFLPVGFSEKDVTAQAEAMKPTKMKAATGQIMNRSVLTFPGEVDDNGKLTFSTKTMGTLADMDDGGDDQTTFWIQRSTPKSTPMDMPPNVRHCYLYINVVGEEEESPELFTRLRLNHEENTASESIKSRTMWAQECLSAPKWKRVRFDRSVTNIENDNDFAGFVLGSAVLIDERQETTKIMTRSAAELTKLWEGAYKDFSENFWNANADDDTAKMSPVVPKATKPGENWAFFDDGDQLSKGKLFPKSVMPKSVMCRPCLGEVNRSFGSLGEPEELLRGILKPTDLKQIYAHIDVLACRNLNSTDADGLCDPCYQIEVEDTNLEAFNYVHGLEIPKSLNPTFMHRLVIPVGKVPVGEDKGSQINLPKKPLTPYPPVVFTLLDKDSRAEDLVRIPGVASALGGNLDFLGNKFDRVGNAWVKYPENLDQKTPEFPMRGQGDAIAANDVHSAMWLALDAPGRKIWEAHSAGHEPTWAGRPRALLSVGFSMRKEVQADCIDLMDKEESVINFAGTKETEGIVFGNIRTKEQKTFEICVDLLGIRNLPGTLYSPHLSVSSSWLEKDVGTIDLRVDVDDTSSPNFNDADLIDMDKFEKFKTSVQSLITLRAPTDDKNKIQKASTESHQVADGDEDAEISSAATSVDANELVGVRIGYTAVREDPPPPDGRMSGWDAFNPLTRDKKDKPPSKFKPILHEAAIIPYLQPKKRDGYFEIKVAICKEIKAAPAVVYKGQLPEAHRQEREKEEKVTIPLEKDMYYVEITKPVEGYFLGDRIVVMAEVKAETDGMTNKQAVTLERGKQGKILAMDGGHLRIQFDGVSNAQWLSKDNGHHIQLASKEAADRMQIRTIAVRPPQTWEQEVQNLLEEEKLDTRRKRQYYVKCHSSQKDPLTGKNEIVFPFSKYTTTYTEKEFPLTFELMSEKDLKENSVVLMPDLVFQLKSNATGMDYGTLSLPFEQPPTKKEQALALSWSEISCKEYEENTNADPAFANMPCLKDAVIEERAYQCFIDVFACQNGYLMWDKDFYVGRNLRSRKLFSMYTTKEGPKDAKENHDDPEGDEEYVPPVAQYFNPADWMVDHPENVLDEAYAKDLTPSVSCAEWVVDPIDAAQLKRGEPEQGKWTSTRTQIERTRNEEPMRRRDLWEFYFKHVNSHPEYIEKKKGHVYILRREYDLCKLSTKLMHERMQAIGWRCASHLISPDYCGDNFREPEEEPVVKAIEAEQAPHLKKMHTHTFMRGVGHVIDPLDRDSRILCRLRMGLPAPLLEKCTIYRDLKSKPPDPATDLEIRKMRPEIKRLCGYQKNLENYLVIKFMNEPGVIIWASPLFNGKMNKFTWNTPGNCLFCVKLNSGSIIQVTVPNFDLRFPHETSWYPVKTLYERFGTLAQRIAEEKEVKAMKKKKAQEEKEKLKEEGGLDNGEGGEDGGESDKKDPADEEEKKKQRKEAMTFLADADYLKTDGYSLPIRVVKNGFVCRIRKRQGSNNFDRVQTKNWWRTVLSLVFPEVRALEELRDPVKDKALVKDMFMQRFLNLRAPLVVGSQQSDRGQIKGHIKVLEVPESNESKELRMKKREELINKAKENRKAAPEESKGFFAPMMKVVSQSWSKTQEFSKQAVEAGKNFVVDDNIERPLRPVDQLWVPASVNIFVYVLSASDLKVTDGSSSITPSLSAQVLGKDMVNKDVLPEVDMKKTRKIDFYDMFALNAMIPGDNTLEIIVKSNHSLSTSVVGKATLDLEDRWLALGMRAQRTLSNKEFILAHRYKDKDVEGAQSLAVSKKTSSVYSAKGRWDAEAKSVLDSMSIRHYNPDDCQRTLKKTLDDTQKKIKRIREDHRNVYWLDPVDMTGNQPIPGSDKKPKPLRKKWESETSVAEYHRIKSAIGPPDRMPVEIVNMSVDDEDTGTSSYAGTLRLWVDMQVESADYHPATIESFNEHLEIRVVCKNLTDITVFRDAFAERNDAFVTARLKVKDYTGKTSIQTVHTDVHTFATNEASWNWQWVFPVHAPASYCELELGVYDQDRLSGDDPIYTPKTYPMDHLLMLAFIQRRDNKPSLGVLRETIIFDDWYKPDEEEVKKKRREENAQKRKHRSCASRCCHDCCSCVAATCGWCCRRMKTHQKPARLHLDIQVLPKEEADRDPKESGVCIAEPTGRIGWRTAVAQPEKFITVLLGPTNKRRLIIAGASTACGIILVVSLMCFFFVMQGTVPIFKGD